MCYRHICVVLQNTCHQIHHPVILVERVCDVQYHHCVVTYKDAQAYTSIAAGKYPYKAARFMEHVTQCRASSSKMNC